MDSRPLLNAKELKTLDQMTMEKVEGERRTVLFILILIFLLRHKGLF